MRSPRRAAAGIGAGAIVIAAALLVPGPPAHAKTVKNMLDDCRSHSGRARAACAGTMELTVRMLTIHGDSGDPHGLICKPEELSRPALVRAYVIWSEANRHAWDEHYYEGIVQALRAAYSCPEPF